jgi:hypothetical protein
LGPRNYGTFVIASLVCDGTLDAGDYGESSPQPPRTKYPIRLGLDALVSMANRYFEDAFGTFHFTSLCCYIYSSEVLRYNGCIPEGYIFMTFPVSLPLSILNASRRSASQSLQTIPSNHHGPTKDMKNHDPCSQPPKWVLSESLASGRHVSQLFRRGSVTQRHVNPRYFYTPVGTPV